MSLFAFIIIDLALSCTGPVIAKVGITKLPFGHLPLMLNNGEMSCQTLTGKLSTVRLDTHVFSDGQGFNEEEVCIITFSKTESALFSF